jgi:hypothetical protein
VEYFVHLGKSIDERWRRLRYDERAFPELATELLDRADVRDHVAPEDVIRHCFSAAPIGPQNDIAAEFGEPPITVFRTDQFAIDVLFWAEATTSVHEHGFSGAFCVLSGSSIHARYRFELRERINCRMAFGDLSLQELELLPAGAVRSIRAGNTFIHSLFHLDRPSTSVVVRTLAEPDMSPQFEYRLPSLAIDKLNTRPTTRRQLQLLELLLRIESSGRPPRLVSHLVEHADLVTTYRVLSRCFEVLGVAACAGLLAEAKKQHGSHIDRLVPVLVEDARKARLMRLRQPIQDPERRFLLATLLNLPSRAAVLDFVRRRFPRHDPVDKVVEWLTSTPPGAPSRLIDIDWDDGSVLMLQSILEGLTLPQTRHRFRRTYGAAAVREQSKVLDGLYGALRQTPLIQPLLS